MDLYSIEAARNRLAESARAVRSPDYLVSNPIAQANASFRMRQSEDPRERVLADMQERMFSLESMLTKTTLPAIDQIAINERQQLIRLLTDQVLRRSGASDVFVKERLGEGPFADRISSVVLDNTFMRVGIDGETFAIGIEPRNLSG
jgi:hypothetical protein